MSLAAAGGRVAAVAVLVGLAGACVPRPAFQGDPVAPVVVRGRVVDANGRGVAGGPLSLQVLDTANSQAGQPIPVLFNREFATGTDGSFELHLGVEPALGDAAANNNGWVNFQLMAFTPDRQPLFPFAFPRQVANGTWADETPSVVISPDGISQPVEPALPTVPPPAPS